MDVYMKMQNSFLGFHSLTLFTLKFPSFKADLLCPPDIFALHHLNLEMSVRSVSVLVTMIILQGMSLSDDNDRDHYSDQENAACDNQVSCRDCITLPQCVYCIDANFTKDISRCMSR